MRRGIYTAVAVLSVCGVFALAGGRVLATSYDVSASVDFPPPAQAAVFTNSPTGQTVNNAQTILTGTCEALTPNGAVSIWRNGVSIGSAPCNGTFSITVVLVPGVNTLIARSASVSALYGPDSQPITVTLVLPTPPPAPPAPTSPATEPAPPTSVTINAGAASNLLARPVQTFGVMNNDNEVALDIVVEGGRNPYTIYLNWGDGSVETKVVNQLGNYRFTHLYAKPGTYTVRGIVRDVLGAETVFSHAVVSEKAVPPAGTGTEALNKLPGPSDAGNGWFWPVTAVLSTAVVAFLGYKLGLLAAGRQRRRKKRPAAGRKAKK